MSRLAALLMFISWLLYGAMPVAAMPPAPVEMAMPVDMHVTREHAGHGDHGAMARIDKAGKHAHGDRASPCPHGGKTCVTPFCAACLTLLPEIAAGDDSPFVHPHPTPGIETSLVFPAPAPLTPPPRT